MFKYKLVSEECQHATYFLRSKQKVGLANGVSVADPWKCLIISLCLFFLEINNKCLVCKLLRR